MFKQRKIKVLFPILINLLLFGFVSAEMRMWTDADGNRFAGEFYKIVVGRLMVKDPGGEIHVLPLEQLSETDRDYLTRFVPPTIEITVRKKSHELPKYDWSSPQAKTLVYTFSISLRKASPLDYTAYLTVELFVLGEDVARKANDHFVLMQDVKRVFRFSPGETEPVEITIPDIQFYTYEPWLGRAEGAPIRGKEYAGYLVVVYDSSGRILSHKEDVPASWMKDDVSYTTKEWQKLWAAGYGVADSCHFNQKFRKILPPRMPWHERHEYY